MKKDRTARPHMNKIRTMILSIFLAVIVWFMVMSLTNPSITTTVSNLDVRFVGEMDLRGKELAITGRKNIPALSATVRGSRSDLMSYMDDIYVQVDISDISEAGEYTLTGTISIPTTRISVEKENYGDIPITVEPLVSKEIEVTVKQTGTLKNQIVDSRAENPLVPISGTESEVGKVAGAVATVDISRVRDDMPERVSYVLTDENGVLINDNETLESPRREIEITNTVYDAKTLPVEPVLSPELDKIYILKSDETTISPSEVTVGVKKDSDYESVTAVIDRVTNGEAEFPLMEQEGLYIPPENAVVKIKTELAGKISSQLDLDVTAENIPDGLIARADNITAVVWGENGYVTEENVHAAVDVSGLDRGEYTLPVYLKEKNFELGGEYTTNVTIE